jgi:hypothetical protein
MNMQKAGIRWAGCSGGDTKQPPQPLMSLLYTVANKGVTVLRVVCRCSYQEQGEPVIAILCT